LATRQSERGVVLRNTEIFNAVAEFGESYDYEPGHALHVSRLALRLFDQLQPLHGMGNTERIWLRAAAMLHDIAKVRDPQNHHKLARDIILDASELPFRRRERRIIGLIARYHRGPLPQDDHRHFRDLDADEQLCVRKLAALLRLADGFDKGHAQLVESLDCGTRRHFVHLRATSRDVLPIDSIFSKADLFAQVFRRRVTIHVSIGRPGLESALDLSASFAYADTH